MQRDYLNYSELVNEATLSIIRKLLLKISKEGMPGEHHFYITFNTNNPGVKISQNLLKKYPKEMTIVIQHQYDDLLVEARSFCITLSFGGKKEFLTIPFGAISCFADPSMNFVLKLELYGFDENSTQSDLITDSEYEEMFILNDSESDNSSAYTVHNNIVDLSSFRKNKKDK